ncbi:MAG: hypothetical protein ACWGNV_15505 [Bacteroidales bacterium]
MKHISMMLLTLIFMALPLSAQQSYLRQNSSGEQQVHTDIQTDTLYEHRPFQFTFLFPPLSTNGIGNVRMVNDVSLNLLVGVSGGVEAFEAGGLINIDRYYVDGFQIAGFGNTVGGHVRGAQAAGFYNITGSTLNGFQGSGFINVTGADVRGVQATGFVNVAGGSVNGFQGTGFVNVAGKDVTGAQVSGFVNVAGKTLSGFQGTGFINVADSADRAVQAAGFGNIARAGNTPFQGSGFFNIAREVSGAQVTGFINVAGKVKGAQVAGFLNICDSIDGVPIGFINVVRKNGYRSAGFSISEVQYANLSYQMGVRRLYTIYSFGKPFGPGSRWMFGAGLGSAFALNENLMLHLEGTVHQELWIGNGASPYFLYIDRLNLYNSLKFLFGWNMQDRVSLHVGPTFNVSVAESNPDHGRLSWNQIAPYAIYNHTANNYDRTNVQIWFGLQGSVRF